MTPKCMNQICIFALNKLLHYVDQALTKEKEANKGNERWDFDWRTKKSFNMYL